MTLMSLSENYSCKHFSLYFATHRCKFSVHGYLFAKVERITNLLFFPASVMQLQRWCCNCLRAYLKNEQIIFDLISLPVERPQRSCSGSRLPALDSLTTYFSGTYLVSHLSSHFYFESIYDFLRSGAYLVFGIIGRYCYS